MSVTFSKYSFQVPFRRHMTKQFAIAFDAYLEILHRVDRRVAAALRRDSPNWRVRNACPPCTYKLVDEPELPHTILIEMDGNNSLKRFMEFMRSRQALPDPRTHRRDYFIPPEEVDLMKDEVTKRRRSDGDEDEGWEDVVESAEDHDDSQRSGKGKSVIVTEGHGEGDPADGADSSTAVCVNRWRNLSPDAKKRRGCELFAESGIFLCQCRHSLTLFLCDMIQSGELYVASYFYYGYTVI
jgi:hypothetical protein